MRSSANSSAIPHISLHIAASSSGKGRKFQPEFNTFDFNPNQGALGLQQGDNLRQKRQQRPDSGQDAYFVTRVGSGSNGTAFGVADGVGGWAEHGVDPADFSHGLCSYMAEGALEWEEGRLGPLELLKYGFRRTTEDPTIRGGGSTACVAVADHNGRMFVANLGDSGFVQLRSGTVHHYSNPQTHAFNTPYQMSITPPEILRQAIIFGGMPLHDGPERADLADHKLRHGDVLVLATDGVWDNLDAQEVLRIVTHEMSRAGAWERTVQRGYVVTNKIAEQVQSSSEPTRTLQNRIAAAIVGEAKNASMDSKRDGPFAKAWQREAPFDRYQGGKVDDITVLVIICVEQAMPKGQLKAKL